MPPKVTGQVRFNPTHGCYETRVRYQDGKRLWILMPKGLTRLQAEARSRSWAKTAKASPSPPPRARAVAQPGIETVDDYFERWSADRKRRGLVTVYDDICRYHAHVSPVIGQMAMARITSDQIEDVKDALNAKASAGHYTNAKLRRHRFSFKSAQNVWMVVKSMFRDASSKGEIRAFRVRKDNPVNDLPNTTAPTRKAKQFLYPSELLAVVSLPAIKIHWRRAYAISTYAYVRAGELEALTWGDVDVEHRTISVNKGVQSDGTIGPPKNGEARTVPIEETLAPLLTVMRSEATTAVRERLGDKAKPQAVQAAVGVEPVIFMPQRNSRADILKADLARAGITRADLFARDATRTPMTFHDLRATGITWCAIRGDQPFELQANAGHKSVTTTEKYIRKAIGLRRGFGEVFPALPTSILQSVRASVRALPSEESEK